MVRKVGKDIWTSLGGKPEMGESETAALVREIREELGCTAQVIEKLGDFEAKAAFDDATVRLSTYLVELDDAIKLSDPELADYRFIDKNWAEQGIRLPDSITQQVLPACIKR